MADINEIKNTVKAGLGIVAEKTKEYAGIASVATKEYAEKAGMAAKGVTALTKLTMELNSEKENINKVYAEIGKLYYETHKDAPEGFFVQLCDEVTLASENIETLQMQVDMLKSVLNPKSDDGSANDDFVVELEAVPAEEPVVEEAPAEEAIAEEAPVEEAPVEEAPEAE